MSKRTRDALQGILEIGKRDMSNPKYDGYFNEAREAVAAFKPEYPIGVSVLLTERELDSVSILLGMRKPASGGGIGEFSTPGGRKEFGEELLDCARREFLEETGARLLDGEIVAYRHHKRYGQEYIMFYCWATSWAGEIKNLIPDKSENWTWHSLDTILGLANFPCTEPPDILRLIRRKTWST